MNPLLIFALGGLAGMLFRPQIKSGLRTVAKGGVILVRNAQEIAGGVKEEIEDVAAEVDAEKAAIASDSARPS